jgi:hypothetical protein
MVTLSKNQPLRLLPLLLLLTRSLRGMQTTVIWSRKKQRPATLWESTPTTTFRHRTKVPKLLLMGVMMMMVARLPLHHRRRTTAAAAPRLLILLLPLLERLPLGHSDLLDQHLRHEVSIWHSNVSWHDHRCLFRSRRCACVGV